jgi:hypothetical protein
MPGQFQVFLSHAQEDYRLVYRVWSILSCLKVQSYMHELYPDYRQDIPSGIRDVLKDKNCVMCITFLTRDGINSQWVQQELGIAYAFDRIIVPVIEEGVEYKGFVQMVRRIPYQTTSPNLMIRNIIYAVRNHVLRTYDATENGLAVTCPSHHEHDYRLPSGWEINHAIDAGNVFVFKCLTCGVEMHVSPQTLEIVP